MTTTTATVSQQLAEFVVESRDEELDPAVAHDSLRRLRDLFGVALAAADSEAANAAAELARIWGGAAEATLLARSEKSGRASAAFYNGTLAHSLDFDDTHLPSIIHPSASAVPAALAAAEVANADPAQLLHGIAAGNEVCIRLGMGGFDAALGNSIFFERGQHATAICGAIGAAVAAGSIYELDKRGIADVIAVSASMGAGILEANRMGGSVKRIHCGWAAHAGLAAAELVRLGITGPSTALEGRFGFFEAFCGERAQVAAVTENLGERWLALDVAFKPYPTNHFTHAIVDGVLRLRAMGIRAEDVDSATIEVPTAAFRTIAEPWDEKVRPPSGYAARFSGPFVFAAAFARGGGLGVYLDDFTEETVGDPQLLDLAARTQFTTSPECDALFPYSFPAILEVRTHGNRTERIEVFENRGTPSLPLADDELETKFLLNSTRAMGRQRAESLNHAFGAVRDNHWLPNVLDCVR
jgi:2-methylcitrate dehydratase PrpD